MTIDNTTKPTRINIVVDDKPKYLDFLREQALEDGQSEEDIKRMSITLDKVGFLTDEFYYDEGENEIHISGSLDSDKGESYISIDIPLSDVLLIDILTAGVKRLNKLKTVLEGLK